MVTPEQANYSRGHTQWYANGWREDVVYRPGVVIYLDDDGDGWRERFALLRMRAEEAWHEAERERFTFWLGAEVERI